MHRIKNLSVYMVSLGCAKNRVDSEKSVAILIKNGCTITDNPQEADCFLINSCGFIGDAREETVDTILELAQYKEKNPKAKLAVMGCMVELFKDKMAEEMPEIDYLLGLSEESAADIYDSSNIDRALEQGAVSAYLKISEGCGNSCSFCSIPIIRGSLKSRPVEDILREARMLIEQGVKEINIVSQDTTRYGADLKMKNGIVELLKNVVLLKPQWIRILYAYPTLISDELIELIAAEASICSYIDVPFQHIDSGVLSRMGRQESEEDIRTLVAKIRKAMPKGAIRTSFIVGFPGETKEEFGRLEQFIKDAKLDHVGLFTYSPEEGTKAGLMDDDVPQEVKEERRDRLMEIQREISSTINANKVGSSYPLLVERFSEDESLLIGRLATQAPEVDGEVILNNCSAEVGEVIEVKMVKELGYDLVGEPV